MKISQAILVSMNIVLLGLVAYLASRPRGGEALRIDEKTGESFYQKNEVKNTIKKRLPALSKCYDAFTAFNPPKADGAIKVDWQISPEGKTVKPEVIANEFGSEKPAAALAECMLNEIRSWRFPEPPNGRHVYIAHKFFFGNPPKKEPPRMVNIPKK